MVDEFQDTNRLQLDVLEALERDNLFAVGDEFQSIYRFRHADVTIFRERRARLGADRVRRLERNFRSREELLDVLNAAFAPELGERFAPLVAGRDPPPPCRTGGAAAAVRPRPGGRRPRGRAPDHRHARVGRAGARTGARPHGARAPAVAARRGAAGRAPAARRGRRRPPARRHRRARARDRPRCGCSSRRSRSRACRPTWSAAAATGRRSRSATASPTFGALANPLDEEALLAVLASPFCGVGTDALVLLTQAGRESGRGAWAALREADGDWAAALADGERARAARLRALLRRRARARRAGAGRGAARAGDRGHRLRPRGAGPLRRRAAAGRTCAS